jgi:hypothetical protein
MSATYKPNSLYGKLRAMLCDNGMFDKDADAILERVIAADVKDTGGSMANRWGTDASGYPPQLMVALLISTKAHAVEWIDEKVPQHWARPMFLPQTAAEEAPAAPGPR